MNCQPDFLVKLIIILYLLKTVSAKFELTNINCTSMDSEFSSFEYCYLKSVNRSYKYMSLKVNLYKVPISDIKIGIAVLRRLNGYKPFLYNITVDGCRFLKHPKAYPVFAYLFGLFKTYSNMNHTCPYDHDLLVEKLSIGYINNQVTTVLPVPEGDYAFQTSWFAKNILRAMVTVFGTLSEK